MSKTVKGLLVLVLVLALVTAAMLTRGILRDQRALREKQAELAASRATWEKIAEEKETLQDELQEVTDALKEARLTLEESETRAEELRAEIESLEQEIADLKDRTGTSE